MPPKYPAAIPAATAPNAFLLGILPVSFFTYILAFSKTGAEGKNAKEGIKINLSLTKLALTVKCLAEGSKHIPFRESKLTRILKQSLGGNSKTIFLAAVSPADVDYEETLEALHNHCTGGPLDLEGAPMVDNFKQLVADFAGVPYGQGLRNARMVAEALASAVESGT